MAASNFDDDDVDATASPAPVPSRRRPAAADDDDWDAPPPPAQAGGQPINSWADSGNDFGHAANAVQQPVVVTTSSVTSNIEDGESKAVGFGRRAQRGSLVGRDKYDADQVTDITEIPDLDGDPHEELTSQFAEAPNVRATRVQPLQELDSQIAFTLPSAMGNGIDLSLLTAALAPQESVAESDVLWEFDQLFADVSSEMMMEMEPEEDKEEEEEDDDGDDADDGTGVEGKAHNNNQQQNEVKKTTPLRDRSNKPILRQQQ